MHEENDVKLSEIFEKYSIDDLRDALVVDKNNLDGMLMQQPMLQQHVSEMAAEVASMRDSAKERLSRVDAQVAKKLRKQLMISEGKVSEARIDREVPLTDEHKEAFFIYNELCALSTKWDALKDTFRNRAFVIRDFVSLYTANYFTDTSFRSQSNPQAVKNFEHSYIRSAMAEGRKARNQLSGVETEVELLADVDNKAKASEEATKPDTTTGDATDAKELTPRERARQRRKGRTGRRVSEALDSNDDS